MKLLEVHCLWGKYAKPGIVKIQKCQYLQGPVTKIEMVVISFCHATFICLAEMKTCLSTFERGCSEEQNPIQKNKYKKTILVNLVFFEISRIKNLSLAAVRSKSLI